MGERIWRGLSPAQAEGLACVVCGADYLTVSSPHVPVGRSETGSQVFACQGACAQRVAQDEEMARWAEQGLFSVPAADDADCDGPEGQTR